ncbi:hypothetical protein CKO42_00950 [Lamprobacter modestohalophilus]|uniref:DUF805 domain-containing protein n=1 Tax=Lamprobacter modestohalophilus TaxID=1064514 RepID=A0A9X1B293_9GAMM|nr:DUF805 domain-containing protein [Lamprobacter modestohalophilus]MCF7977869.1 DUF805 domain-containing protein [Chromatiaceae bacterium]MBK1617040.1 hypothetical protein [Lamprobacter modestohalophilus]MCF7996582.1 DUF805 domain-containing protein [Chromatiaceae bacterium]MCF8004609.1 DUF805 domain-containing protein [Chromatiaceae bacterium]MCF8017704.1 DUF805 domain-containing protein [Chromatiaceae bacterium]
MNWYLEVLRKYAVFTGRARRKEYWYYFLINFLIITALLLIDNMLGTLDPEAGMGLLSGIYALAVLIPGIAVAVRRLHDTDRTGWWVLIALIPIVGPIILIFFLIQDSTAGDNRFGPNPKAVETEVKHP